MTDFPPLGPSFEAKLIAAKETIRRLQGQIAVMNLAARAAEEAISDVRTQMTDLLPVLIGDDRRRVEKIDRRCQTWEIRLGSLFPATEDSE